jgi:cell shape-determining protein MreC
MKINDKLVRQYNNPGALVNNDVDGYHAYKMARRKNIENQDRIDQINNISEEVDQLKNDISEIKQLLMKVLESK